MTQVSEELHVSQASGGWHASTHDSHVVLDRAEFLARLETAAEVASPVPKYALLLLDVNDFQSINDAFGTKVGDSVLEVIAHRLLVGIDPGDVVGTLGGDRFGVLTPVRSRSGAVELGRKLLALVASPIHVLPYDVAMTGRVGVNLLTEGPDAASSTLRYATMALRDAKAASAVRAVACAPPVSDSSDRRASIRREIGQVLDTERLRLVYQPIVALTERTIVGYEALLRWRMSDATEASEEFVSVAESLGLIEQVGRWALDQAIGQVSRFDATTATAPIMAVNLSARQFADPRLVRGRGEVVGQIRRGTVEARVGDHGKPRGQRSQRTRHDSRLAEFGLPRRTRRFRNGAVVSQLPAFAADRLHQDRSFFRGGGDDGRESRTPD